MHRERGCLTQAESAHRQALAGAREGGDRHAECEVLNDLAKTLLRAGRTADAIALHQRALELAERHEYLVRLADAHVGLGRCLAARTPGQARRHWQRAVAIYRRLDLPQQFALAAALARPADGESRKRTEPGAGTEPRTGTAPLQRRKEVAASRPSC